MQSFFADRGAIIFHPYAGIIIILFTTDTRDGNRNAEWSRRNDVRYILGSISNGRILRNQTNRTIYPTPNFPKRTTRLAYSPPHFWFLKIWLLRLGRKLPYTNQRKNEWPHALRLVSNYPIEGHQFRTKSMGYDLLVACNRLNFTTVIRSSMD